jgi:MFS transporter, DHA2 family, multidrug resistance protein
MLILFRVIQGVGGGGLQPMAQAILADTFPPQKRGLAFALYGITTIMAPTIGPTLGGWLTDNYSWRWIFYINLPVGIMTLFLVLRMVEDPPYLAAQRSAGVRVDYIGIGLLRWASGALRSCSTRARKTTGSVRTSSSRWRRSRRSACLRWCFGSAHEDARHRRAHVQELQLRRGQPDDVLLGVLLFSSLVMMPQFLQTLMGYTAQSAGLVLSGASVIILFEMPIVGQLTTKIPGEIHHGVWLAEPGVRDVLFHQSGWIC